MAILLGCDSVHLEFPTKLIARDVTLGVNEGDRIGIVGKTAMASRVCSECSPARSSPTTAG